MKRGEIMINAQYFYDYSGIAVCENFFNEYIRPMISGTILSKETFCTLFNKEEVKKLHDAYQAYNVCKNLIETNHAGNEKTKEYVDMMVDAHYILRKEKSSVFFKTDYEGNILEVAINNDAVKVGIY